MDDELRAQVEHALKHEIAPALMLDGTGIEVIQSVGNPSGGQSSGVCNGFTPWPNAHGHQASDHVMIWKSFAGFEPTAALPGCRSTRVPKSARTAATARSTAARHPAVRELGLLSGPEGTRTPGLLAASQSLSQLSYGPVMCASV